jgi:hypothetical protein
MDRQTNRVQQAVLQATQSIKALPFAEGNMLENLSLIGGGFAVNPIAHGLPQAWRGAMLMTIRTPGITWSVGNLPALYSPNEFIIVLVSGNCTVDLWVW